jgi:hypothetical protein
MTDLVAYAEKMRGLATEQDLKRRALLGAEVALDNCKAVEIELGIVPLGGYDRERISTRVVKHALVFEYDGNEVPYVETIVELFIEGPCNQGNSLPFNRPIGTYRLITLICGAYDGDFLILD